MWLQNACIIFSVTLVVAYKQCDGCIRPTNTANRMQKSQLKVNGPWIVDSAGRIRLFHGFNAVEKQPPWYPDSLSDVKLKYYQEWGFNVVRLGMMWTGVNPQEGVINTTYLDIMKDMVKRAGDHGLYVLLDMHQDVISSEYDAYDGVPRWVIDKCPPPEHPYPWPLTRKLQQWADGYLTEAVGNAFQCIYDNANGTRNDMAKFWTTVAKTFKDFDNIMGYELINEPWAGNIYKDPSLLLPGSTGRKNLAPLYDALNKAIRKVDNDTLLFYEPVTWGMILPGTGDFGSGFKTVPGGSAYADKSVLSWHYYCHFLTTDDQGQYNGLVRFACDKLLGPKVYQTVQKDIKRTGGSAFLTEYGLCRTDGKVNDTETIECNFIMAQADDNFQSWTYWDSEFFNKTGKVNLDVAEGFARTYATAIAGIPQRMNFDPETKTFYFSYKVDPNINAPTEIKVPRLQYPHGFTVKLSKFLKSSFDEVTSTLIVSHVRRPNVIHDMQVAEVIVTRK